MRPARIFLLRTLPRQVHDRNLRRRSFELEEHIISIISSADRSSFHPKKRMALIHLSFQLFLEGSCFDR